MTTTTKTETAETIPMHTPWKVEGGELPASDAEALDATGAVVLRGKSAAVRVAVALANKTLDLDEKAARLFWRRRAEEMERQANTLGDKLQKLEADLRAARAQLLALGAKNNPAEKAVAVVVDDEAVAKLAVGEVATLPKEKADALEAARTAPAPTGYADRFGHPVAPVDAAVGDVLADVPSNPAPAPSGFYPPIPLERAGVSGAAYDGTERPKRASVSPAEALAARDRVNAKVEEAAAETEKKQGE